MTFRDVIANIEQLDREDVIFAKPQWTAESEAAAFKLTADSRIPAEVTEAGYQYLLEVDVALQVLEEFRGARNVSLEQKCRRIIDYAERDA